MKKPALPGAIIPMERRKADSLKFHSALAAEFVATRPLVSRTTDAHERDVVFFLPGLGLA